MPSDSKSFQKVLNHNKVQVPRFDRHKLTNTTVTIHFLIYFEELPGVSWTFKVKCQ